MSNIDQYNVTVTNTAQSLKQLVETASSAEVSDSDVTEVKIQPSGNIRIAYDGNIPTGSKGFTLTSGSIFTLVGIPLRNIQMIRIGGSNVAVDVLFGYSNK